MRYARGLVPENYHRSRTVCDYSLIKKHDTTDIAEASCYGNAVKNISRKMRWSKLLPGYARTPGAAFNVIHMYIFFKFANQISKAIMIRNAAVGWVIGDKMNTDERLKLVTRLHSMLLPIFHRARYQLNHSNIIINYRPKINQKWNVILGAISFFIYRIFSEINNPIDMICNVVSCPQGSLDKKNIKKCGKGADVTGRLKICGSQLAKIKRKMWKRDGNQTGRLREPATLAGYLPNFN